MQIALLLLFVASGFSALIYQSVWTQYLGLLLGHAAYAQTLVLVMFMGGMAIGAWAVSRLTTRLRSLIGCYAAIELLIGLAGFAFHGLFIGFVGLSETQVLPALQGHWAAKAWPWLGAGSLIAVQTILLGATFPLIAGGMLRWNREAMGATLGGLYFANGLGAAAGALAASFLLLPLFGLPGSLQVAAGMNLLLAAGTAWIAFKAPERGFAAQGDMPAAQSADLRGLQRTLLAATFLSSAASFGYEIGWVRMLNQALGTTLHGFELMLAAFIFGIACGGLWIRHRGDHIVDVVRYAGYVQVAMGTCALLSVPVLARSFEWVGWLTAALARTDGGYALYSVATAVIALLVMAPAAFFAGMTLPLFTTALLRRGAGEAAIGRVYAANTIGAIFGVVTVVHGLIPLMGISLSVLVAAAIDVLIGLWLLRGLGQKRWTLPAGASAVGTTVVAGLVLQFGLPSNLQQASGVFRTGVVDETKLGQLLYFRDGSTATVSARLLSDHTAVISTNGKPDAGLRAKQAAPTPDEITMLMLGMAPLAWHPQPKEVAVIGWGSGLSTHTLLGSSLVQRVDTIEIERAMWEGAKTFLPFNARAYEDPRSFLRIEDARTFLATHDGLYDAIVSEPSNPWVSGVASLFTKEFYSRVRGKLREDGLLVQWIHAYEMSDALLAEMVAALLPEFPHSELLVTNSNDFVILARTKAAPAVVVGQASRLWESPALAEELRRVGLRSIADLQVRRVGGAAMLRTFVRQHQAQAHSDFYPSVALNAPKARFKGQAALQLPDLVLSGLPVLNALECRVPMAVAADVTRTEYSSLVRTHLNARAASEAFSASKLVSELEESDPILAKDIRLLRAQLSGVGPFHAATLHQAMTHLASSTVAHLPKGEAQRLWDEAAWQAKLPREAPEWLRAQVKLYAAWLRNDWREVQRLAAQLLAEKDPTLTPLFRHGLLVYGSLASMVLGERDAATRWDKQYGGSVPKHLPTSIRDFLKAWDGHESVCAASG
ncbi:fused MFS/spermidine synthase [Paucibacter sp. O1-1]|nr:fused MFS/spermidine synthase [Paucibacter sp. O1-1]MDA3825482.1 fused MFS/spermidine synthase [Paucibacter sp. O1-1]